VEKEFEMRPMNFIVAVAAVILAAAPVYGRNKRGDDAGNAPAKVYLTRDISPESLVKIYKALGVKAEGRVAVKISTGEGSNPNYLKPTLIRDLVDSVNGTIVENRTAYAGDRMETKDHWNVIHQHGFDSLFAVDLLDEYDEIRIPVKDRTHIKYDIVGGHLANYDFMVCLSHFKGHPMGGYGGALKNLSIGCASRNGKAYIHSAGKVQSPENLWTAENIGDQDGFLESMAAAAQAVVDYFKAENGIIYISVMNNMSIDCDCVAHPAPVKLKDYGILASTDPVALDQACVDIINDQKVTPENDPTDMLNRIDKQHGTHTIDWAEHIGLGTKEYVIIDIDK
jgi:uncharacterized Fe-S center protein